MESFVRAWDKFWFSRFDPVSVSVYRILLGLLMFIYYLASYPNWERFYSYDGIFSLDPNNLTLDSWWSIFSYTEKYIPIKVFWWVGFMSTIAFAVGYKTRVATIILFILQSSMNSRNSIAVNGEDLIFRMVLFYSCFAPLGHCFSIDSYLKKISGNTLSQMPTIWAIRAMQINIAMIYLVNIPNKLTDDFAWLNGEAIYWTMANNMWSKEIFTDWFYKWDCLLSKIISYGTLFVEGTFPLLVCIQATRLFSVSLLMLLHIGITFLIPNVTYFTLSMVCVLWVFIPPEITRKTLLKFNLEEFI